MYRLEIDIAWNCPIQSCLEWFDKFHAQIKSYEAHGPGGENPRFFLLFANKADRYNFYLDYKNTNGLNPVTIAELNNQYRD